MDNMMLNTNIPPFDVPKPKLILLPGGEIMEQSKRQINSFRKYEVIYGFKSSDEKYNHKKYIARVITNDIEEYVSEGNTQYITVYQFYEVGKRRANYLCDKGKSFEFVRYK